MRHNATRADIATNCGKNFEMDAERKYRGRSDLEIKPKAVAWNSEDNAIRGGEIKERANKTLRNGYSYNSTKKNRPEDCRG